MVIKELKQIKNLKVALKDMEPYIKNPIFLTQGKRFSNFNMLIREAWANWLLCVVLQKLTGDPFTFQESEDGDGIVGNKRTKAGFVVEHVCAMDFPAGEQPPKGEDRVLWAINHKVRRGTEYAKDKRLVVFFDGAGEFYRNRIRKDILGRHRFDAVFCVGLLESNPNGHSYSVTEFRDSFGDKSITHKVEINKNFTDWKITQIMQ